MLNKTHQVVEKKEIEKNKNLLQETHSKYHEYSNHKFH